MSFRFGVQWIGGISVIAVTAANGFAFTASHFRKACAARRKVTKALLPLSFGASPRLGMPSLRSCSVGPPPSAIHGRGRLTRHPCRVAHCAEPPLGLTRGRTPQQRPRRPTGRPVCWMRSSVGYLVGWQAAIASKLAPTEEQSKSRASRTTASLLTTHQAER